MMFEGFFSLLLGDSLGGRLDGTGEGNRGWWD